MDLVEIRRLLRDLGWDDEGASCAIITRARRPAGAMADSVDWLQTTAAEALPEQMSRVDAAVVFDQFDAETKDGSRHLLARLRDQLARRVVIRDDERVFTATELLALGYIKDERPQARGRFFVHDPDRFYERREWNNSKDWANPENFDKYRW